MLSGIAGVSKVEREVSFLAVRLLEVYSAVRVRRAGES